MHFANNFKMAVGGIMLFNMENYVSVGSAIYSLCAKLLPKITSYNADFNFGIAFDTRAANE